VQIRTYKSITEKKLKTIKMNTDKVNLAPKHLRIWDVEVGFREFLIAFLPHPEQRGLWYLIKRLNKSRAASGVLVEILLSKPGIKIIIIRFCVRIVYSTKMLRTGWSTDHSNFPILLPTPFVGNKVAYLFACDSHNL
jgi:hypothetical protein